MTPTYARSIYHSESKKVIIFLMTTAREALIPDDGSKN